MKRRPHVLALLTGCLVASSACASGSNTSSSVPAALESPAPPPDEPATLLSTGISLDESFAPLRPILADRRVVLLGEQSHGDGATFEEKVALVRWLHESAGFDVLLFESDVFGCERMSDSLQAGTSGSEAARLCLFPLWTRSAQLMPLWDYIETSTGGDTPLAVGGFDSKLTSPATKASLTAVVSEIVAAEPDARAAWADAEPVVAELLASPMKFELDDRAEAKLVALASAAPNPRAKVIFDSIVAHARSMSTLSALLAKHGAKLEQEASPAELNNVRDRQMAENLIHLLNDDYADRKVIVWAANTHIARNIDTVKLADKPDYFEGFLPMGEWLHRELGDEMYSIAFTAGGGAYGYPGRDPIEIELPVEDSLEARANELGPSTLFFDLSSSGRAEVFDHELAARPFGHHYAAAVWPEVFDAIVFQETMTPSTAAEP